MLSFFSRMEEKINSIKNKKQAKTEQSLGNKEREMYTAIKANRTCNYHKEQNVPCK